MNNNRKKLNFLLTNDDGIDAEGISVLARVLEEIADIYILAPDSNRSGVSSHFVMSEPLVFKRIGDRRVSCSGYPVDCVITALRSDIFPGVEFDAVFSGINKGANMGTDCIYSGTIAAARQAVLYEIPGIAVSLKAVSGEYADSGYDYASLAEFIKRNINQLIGLYRKNCVVSVNALSRKKFKGAKLTSLCIRDYKDKIVFEDAGSGTLKSRFASGELLTTGPEQNEYDAVMDGYVAVSRLCAEPVDFVDSVVPQLDFVL